MSGIRTRGAGNTRLTCLAIRRDGDEKTVNTDSEDDCLRIACAEAEKDSVCVTPIENSEKTPDSELHGIINAWPKLPEHMKDAIRSLVEPYLDNV